MFSGRQRRLDFLSFMGRVALAGSGLRGRSELELTAWSRLGLVCLPNERRHAADAHGDAPSLPMGTTARGSVGRDLGSLRPTPRGRRAPHGWQSGP